MTLPRCVVVSPGIEGMFHCVSRCVRRAYLCGKDCISGKSFEHRKDWVKDRLKFLSEVFAIDIAGYSVMSNHLHIVLRTRPDRVLGWTDEEVALRWLTLFSRSRSASGEQSSALREKVAAMKTNSTRIQQLRKRMSDLSWFMRCLNEYMARRANREDGCKGRFWEGRFKCQALLDEAAVLACMAYVDLNPIRAKIAQTPEESDYTSAQDRIQGRWEDGKSRDTQIFT